MMISASEYLSNVVLNADESKKYKKTLADIEEGQAAQKPPNLSGFFVDVHPERIDPKAPNVARALQITLQKLGWSIEFTLLPSELNPRLPGAWRCVCTPREEALNGATVNLTDDQMSLC